MFRKESRLLRQSLKIKKGDAKARLVTAGRCHADELLIGGSNRNPDASAMTCIWELEPGRDSREDAQGGSDLPAHPLERERLGIRYSLVGHFLAAEFEQGISPVRVLYLPSAKWGQSEWLSIQLNRTKVNHSCKALSIAASINLSVYLRVCNFKRQVKKFLVNSTSGGVWTQSQS